MTNTKCSFPVSQPDIGSLEKEYINKAFDSGWISSLGRFIPQFENEFAGFCETAYGVAVSNGTVALHLALVAAGIGVGDEVICPSLTFAATAAAICYTGADVVFADCEPEIGTICPLSVERAITDRTKAIIVVHLYGHPVDMDPIIQIARDRKIVLIEDVAEAHGAKYKGKQVGSFGDFATFSFYGNKIITTGEGGMIVTNDKWFDERLRFLRDHAMDMNRRYWHSEIGFNYRLTNIQAALGLAQLFRIEELLSRRTKLLNMYRDVVSKQGVDITLNPQRNWASAVNWLVCAILPASTEPHKRDEIIKKLKSNGVDTRPYFIPLHLMPPYSHFRRVSAVGNDALKETELLSSLGFNLPTLNDLTEQDVHYIVDVLGKALE